MLSKPSIVEPWHVTMARGYWLRAKQVSFKTLHRDRAPGTAPVGDGNGKTALPTTYRAVGETCPTTCPRLPVSLGGDGGCFGLGGRPAISSKRDREAGSTRDASVRAVALALAYAAANVTDRGRPMYARIHGVGDFGDAGNVGDVDMAYVEQVGQIARELRRLSGRRWVGFGYTHMADPKKPAPAWVRMLRRSGVRIKISDKYGSDGAIVVPDHSPETMARYPMAFACPEQTHGISCATCGACVNTDRPVAFSAMGHNEKNLATILRSQVT